MNFPELVHAEISALTSAVVFALPFVLTGLCHILVINRKLLDWAARVPLDRGALLWGRRVFGDNKTLRGALVIVLGLSFWTPVVARVTNLFPGLEHFPFFDFTTFHALLWGFAAGIGWIVGELLNSFAKRQIGISPGHAASGPLGGLFWFIDQIDGLVGVLVFTSMLPPPPSAFLIIHLVLVALVFHVFGALIMMRLDLKDRVG